jgi:hypothetical protein
MKQFARSKRPRTDRSRPRLEWLEPRVLCAVALHDGLSVPNDAGDQSIVGTSGQTLNSQLGPFLTVVSTDPPTSATPIPSLDTVTVVFDRPIDPDFFGNDLLLLRLNDDGSITSIFETGPVPFERPDSAGTGLVVSLNQSLPPGHYQFFLSAQSSLMGTDYSMIDSDGTDQLLGDFFVGEAGHSLPDAINLDLQTRPGSEPTTVPGTLDFGADPTAIGLYKIELPFGHFWQLGIEVSAYRDGSRLDTALSLFNSEKNPIATASIGRSDFPADPYLFVGLPGGTYYIGVSGEGNIPGLPGGYDLASGSVGSAPQAQPGGAYTLHVVATPADQPISLQKFTVDHADPDDPTPTGLTLAFSGALRTAAGDRALAASMNQSIEVVDQTGRIWPVTAIDYIESDARLSFLFNDRLTPGRYVVRLPAQGGLTDLAGLSPSTRNQPAGILGTFTVMAGAKLRSPQDLGALLPSAAAESFAAYTVLSPGDSVTYRFVITVPGNYSIQALYSGGALVASITDSRGTHKVDPATLNTENANLIALEKGVYLLHLTSSGRLPLLVLFKIKSPSFSPESLLENGVGQGAALNLRLIAPTALTPDPLPVGPTEPTTPDDTPRNDAPTGNSLPGRVAIGGGAIVTLGDFVGRPVGSGNHFSAIGPGGLALASLGDGLLGGLGESYIGHTTNRFGHRTNRHKQPARPPKNGAMIGEGGLPGALTEDATDFDLSWLDNPGLLPDGQADQLVQAEGDGSEGDAAGLRLAGELPVDVAIESEGVEQAALISPLGAGLIAALAIHYRNGIRRLLKRLSRRSGEKLLWASRVSRPRQGSSPGGLLTNRS